MEVLKAGWSQRLPTLVNAMSVKTRNLDYMLLQCICTWKLRGNIDVLGSNGSKILCERWFEDHHWLALHDAKAGNVESLSRPTSLPKNHSPLASIGFKFFCPGNGCGDTCPHALQA